MFITEGYIKKALDKYPKLTLIEQCGADLCQNGHIFLVAAFDNIAHTAALSISHLELKVNDEEGIKDLVAHRLQMIANVLVPKEV